MFELLLLAGVTSLVVWNHRTARAAAEAQRARDALQDERDALLAELAHNDRLLSVGMATAELTHELRAPLANALMGLRLAQRVEPDRCSELLARAEAQLQRMDHLSRQVGALTRPTTADVATATQATETALALIPRSEQHRIHCDLPGELPALDICPLRLSQAVHNLVNNALQHADAVRVEARWAGDDVCITVHDDGPGVPPALRDRVFDRFHTGRAETGGTGLGLPLVKRVVEAAGGSVALDAGPLGGARFTLQVPALLPSAHARAA